MKGNSFRFRLGVWLLLMIFPSMGAWSSCGGSCGGCTPIWPQILKASESIKKAYDKAEKDIAKKYTEDIIPLQTAIWMIERENARLSSKIERMELQITNIRRGIIHQLDGVRKIEATRPRTQIPSESVSARTILDER